MLVRKTPMRTCVVSKEKCEKKDLIRIVKNKDGEVFIDISGKKNGRGAYLKKDIEVLDKAIKNHTLERVLDCKIDDSIYEELREIMK